MLTNPFLLAVLCAFLGGSTPVAAKVALEVFPPFTLLLIRFGTATLFLLPFVLRSGEVSVGKFKQLWKVAIIGSLNPVIFIIGIQFTQASVSPFIYSSVPALTALYLYVVTGVRVSMKQVFGIVLGLFGVGIIILLPLAGNVAAVASLGNLLLFAAAISFMYYGIVSKKYQGKRDVSPLALTFYMCVVTLFAMLPLSIWELMAADGGLRGVVEVSHVLAGVATGVLGTGMFYLVYQWALAAGNELAAALFTYIQPVATIVMAMLFLGEQVGLWFLVGGVLAVVGARVARG